MKLVLALALFLVGCVEPNTAREACYIRANLHFQEQAAKCDTDECIDLLVPAYKAEQEACE